PSGNYNVKVSYIGYQPTQINNVEFTAERITFLDINLRPTALSLESVEIRDYKSSLIAKDKSVSGETITSEEISKLPGRSAEAVAITMGGVFNQDAQMNNWRGTRSDAYYNYIDGVKLREVNSLNYTVPTVSTLEVETSNYISNTLKSNVTNLEYTIEIPYSIPSDGEDYSIKIKEVSLTVDYVYHAVPKLENDVFLTAEIVGWTELNLLSGKSSIYYQGTFTGESYIDANQAGDTLNVSLGRDRNIIVKREGSKEMNDKQILGKNIKETLGWNITVKNNKSAKIKIIVDDQFPVSEKKSIEVERLDYSNAKLEDKTGKLSWELQIEPNDKKVVSFKYSVKYPKYVNLMIE
ncbi:MAG: mucoidy inhibitor MuiA family protein, partial [Bacteroidota bacterium]